MACQETFAGMTTLGGDTKFSWRFKICWMAWDGMKWEHGSCVFTCYKDIFEHVKIYGIWNHKVSFFELFHHDLLGYGGKYHGSTWPWNPWNLDSGDPPRRPQVNRCSWLSPPQHRSVLDGGEKTIWGFNSLEKSGMYLQDGAPKIAKLP